MVLSCNVPDEANEKATAVLTNRLPNFCPECGGEIVVAGGRINPEPGWYEHLDPEVTCGVSACVRYRFTAGVEQEEGQQYRVAPGAEEWDQFDGLTAYCDIHDEDMVKTKDLKLNGRATRQYKCPECSREAVIQKEE